ncbi:MAG: glycosyltransferase [bacterium]|nr:glycosyltransferase [bacterium]
MNNSTFSFKNILIYFLFYLISIGLILSIIFLPKHAHETNWAQNIIVFASVIFVTKYFIYMIISAWYDTAWALKKIKNNKIIKAYNPKVSVLIPAWNEEVGVLKTMKSLIKSTYRNLEIVVINDGSTDQSDNLIRSFISDYSTKFQNDTKFVYHYKENGGKGTALNTGITLATGEIILTIDADSIVEKTAVANFVAHFADPKVMAAVGNVKVGNTTNFIAVLQYLEFLFSFYLKRADSIFGSIYIIGGAAGAFRKNLFEKLGPYSENNITEDIELTVRIQKAGLKIVYAADSVIYTEGANDISGLLKQRLRWKRGRLDTFIEHKNLFFSSRKGHNKFLTWFVLPFVVLGDTQLLLEIPFLVVLYIYSYAAQDFSPFIASLFLVILVFIIQIFVSDRKFNKTKVFPFAPIAWLMFYTITLIELNALFKSVWSLYKKREIKWQSWDRKGINS